MSGRARRYVAGWLMALVLTCAAFGLVAWGGLAKGPTLAAISALALIQMAVHLVFFLDLGRRRIEGVQRSDVEVRAALLFAAVLALIVVGGTLVVMSDLAHRMMGHAAGQ